MMFHDDDEQEKDGELSDSAILDGVGDDVLDDEDDDAIEGVEEEEKETWE